MLIAASPASATIDRSSTICLHVNEGLDTFEMWPNERRVVEARAAALHREVTETIHRATSLAVVEDRCGASDRMEIDFSSGYGVSSAPDLRDGKSYHPESVRMNATILANGRVVAFLTGNALVYRIRAESESLDLSPSPDVQLQVAFDRAERRIIHALSEWLSDRKHRNDARDPPFERTVGSRAFAVAARSARGVT